MRATAPRFTAESYTYSWATQPDHWYVWDAQNRANVGGNYATQEAAQAAADERNGDADDLTVEEYAIADRLVAALEAADRAGLTPSMAGRAAKVDTITARRILAWMVAGQYAHTSGNGAWTRYHAGRA